MTPDEARAVTALETYYRLECRTLAGTWIAYESSTADQGWTPRLRYVEAHLEEALEGCPENADEYRIVTQRRGPITVYPQEADTPTGPGHLAVGTVIESAADPRIAALPVGSVLLDRDRETVAKRSEAWAGLGYIPIESEGEEFGPWTVRRIGLGADQ